jgi:L-threonylcarbamoyladenylate synthase
VGVESTILDCTGPAPRLLRPGAVDAAAVRTVTGLELASGPSRVRAPGTLATHYAPHAQVRLVDGEAIEGLAVRDEAARHAGEITPTVGLLAPADLGTPPGLVRLSAPRSVEEYARVLYAALREADALGLRQVLAVPPGGEGLGAAVTDRLARAAAGR